MPKEWTGGDIDLASGKDNLVDMDGDGMADLVHYGPGTYQMQVLRNTGAGWNWAPQYSLYQPVGAPDPATSYHFEDVNRDGLMDLVGPHGSDINTGTVQSDGSAYQWIGSAAGSDPTLTAWPGARNVGDIDGDGLYDRVALYEPTEATDGTICHSTSIPPTIAFNTGIGMTTDGSGPYVDAVNNNLFDPNYFQDNFCARHGIQALSGSSANMMDVNADGLVDYVTPYATYINTGTTWANTTGVTGWISSGTTGAPAIPTTYGNGHSNGVAYIDLDGDGIQDLAKYQHFDFAPDVKGTWLNTFSPPVITGFSNGLAKRNVATYKSITKWDAQTPNGSSGATYSDPNGVALGTARIIMPMRVVSSVLSEDGTGTGSTTTTTYRYESLRTSTTHRGPQGFGRVLMTDAASGITTATTYAQVFPYTGLP